MEKKKSEKRPLSATFKAGAVCLAFLIIGYQVALFVQRATVLRLEANRDAPDTVYVYADGTVEQKQSSGNAGREGRTGSLDDAGGSGNRGGGVYRTERHDASHSPAVEDVREATRRIESFRFNPNTVSVEDLQRLGFSRKQAESIDNYRSKGGRFRRKEDFAKSFVVADSVYRRLEPYIDIPKVDINKADSAAFDALPGIGGYFAAKMVEYREALGGYSYPEQLMDIYHFDREKYDGLKDLIICSPAEPFALWTLPEDSLALHPYIRNRRTAHAIVLFRENSPSDSLTAAALGRAGILDPATASKLSRCNIR